MEWVNTVFIFVLLGKTAWLRREPDFSPDFQWRSNGEAAINQKHCIDLGNNSYFVHICGKENILGVPVL